VMGHIQHLSLESLVKIDHFQKEPPEISLRVNVRFVPKTTSSSGSRRSPSLGEPRLRWSPGGRPTEQVTITCYFKAKTFEMLSRLAISFAV
jgi:hypothetical protein